MPDPDVLLARERETRAELALALAGLPPDVSTAAARHAAASKALDDWMSDGGNSPSAWGPQPPVSIGGRMEPLGEPLPEGTAHDPRLRPSADPEQPGLTAYCEPCGWTDYIGTGRSVPDLIRLMNDHAGATS